MDGCCSDQGESLSLSSYDVVVAGGGTAGVGAAYAAAETGARTLLVERLEVLGGLGTAGGVGNFCFGDDSLPHGQGGVFDRIWDGLRRYDAIGVENGWGVIKSSPFFNHTFDHNILAIVLQELLEGCGVDLLFATDVIGSEVDNGTVRAAILHNRSLTQRVEAKVFIDCTGDGILSRHAGGVALPDDPNHPQCIPPSFMVFLHRTAAPQEQVVLQESGEPLGYSVWREAHRIGLKTKWPGRDFDTATGMGYSDAVRAFRRRIPEFVRHFQQTEEGKPFVFDYAAPMFGLRDGVRVAGEYVVTQEDFHSARRFPDAVAHGCFPFDSAYLKPEALAPYQIPYGSLLVKNTQNVLVAGRCFSATRIALSSARIMATCCLMGQAAGIAARMAVQNATPLRTIDPAHIRAAICQSAPQDKLLHTRLGE